MREPPWRRMSMGTRPVLPAWSTSAPVPFDTEALPSVDAEWAWAGADGHGVRVCVLDSGVDGTHPLIGPLEASLSVSGDHVAECLPIDEAGHGTACAGIIRSVAPRSSITSVRVLTEGASGSGSTLLTGLEWAIEQGFDVINLSLATTQAKLVAPLHELADRAYFRRTTLVVSAHNRPIRGYPWTFSSVISVGSHDSDDPMAYYYNPAPPVEFYGRGVRVPVAWPGGGVLTSTGNSFAAPHIAGICALILSKHPWLTPFQLKTVLFLTAANVAGTSPPVPMGDEHG